MKTNVLARATTPGFTTHEGAPAVKENAEKELTRAVSACLLWEDSFYESGNALAERIADLCKQVSIPFLCGLAVKARTDLKLRHVPLWLCVQALARPGPAEHRSLVGDTIAEVIQRADELAEIFALYWKGGKKPLPRQLKAGVAKAFRKFDAYRLAKYNRDSAVKLRDALFLSHAKPADKAQAALWKKLVDKTLESPDTWEVELSAGKDKKETFTRLLAEKKLGYMALLRNLRNIVQAGVELPVVEKALLDGAPNSKALPFRFVAAARHAGPLAQAVSEAMLAAVKNHPKLPGTTYFVVDVSGSMDCQLSGKSELKRFEAGGALAVLLREVCEHCRVFTFSKGLVEVMNLRGIGLMQGIANSQPHGGTFLSGSLQALAASCPRADRVIVVTDEQAHDGITVPPGRRGYLVNVATYAPALPVAVGGWVRLSGFSERLADWIMAEEDVTQSPSGAPLD